MQIRLLVIGKTQGKALTELLAFYTTKINHYIPFRLEVLPEIKKKGSLSPELLRKKEAEAFLKKLDPQEVLWLLDEKGREFSSVQFSEQLQKCMNAGPKSLVFIVGGAFGFDPSIYSRAQAKVSLSKMTFNHQMVRLIFCEQLYRAFSILRNEPYHNN